MRYKNGQDSYIISQLPLPLLSDLTRNRSRHLVLTRRVRRRYLFPRYSFLTPSHEDEPPLSSLTPHPWRSTSSSYLHRRNVRQTSHSIPWISQCCCFFSLIPPLVHTILAWMLKVFFVIELVYEACLRRYSRCTFSVKDGSFMPKKSHGF